MNTAKYNKLTYRKITAFLMILEFLIILGPYLVLSAIFDFPDILRKPADVVLNLFNKNSGTIIVTYYFFMLSGVLMIPLAIMVHRILTRRNSYFMNIATTFGVVTGIVQFLGFIRWPFMIPYLADRYLDPEASEATREAVTVVYHAFNQYAGVAVGEHLGFLFTAIWSLMISIVMLKSPLFKSWLGWAGILIAIALIVSTLEQFNFSFSSAFGMLFSLSYTGWLLWLIAIAVHLLRARHDAVQQNIVRS